jgi:hypothetical protein
VIKKTGIVPGAVSYFSVLLPDVEVAIASPNVAVQTFGFLSLHRPVSKIGPGQDETYTVVALHGTAANIERPL